MEQGAKRGNYEDDRPETPIRTFNALNAINKQCPGVSMADFMTGMGITMAKNSELKEAEGF